MCIRDSHYWTTEESGSECDHLEQRQRSRRRQCHRMDSDYATDYLHQRRPAAHYDRPCFDAQPIRRKHDRSTSNDRPSSRRGSRSGSGTHVVEGISEHPLRQPGQELTWTNVSTLDRGPDPSSSQTNMTAKRTLKPTSSSLNLSHRTTAGISLTVQLI